jgi:hypothetical protein
MKKLVSSFLLLFFAFTSMAQSTFSEDLKTVFETIKTGAFKNSYQYVITYADADNASVFVKEKHDYMIFYVYDNTDRPVPNMKAYLMTPDNEVKKRYTAKSVDLGQIGVARVAQIKFSTRKFTGDKDKQPVKIEASPKSTIYIFERKNED